MQASLHDKKWIRHENLVWIMVAQALAIFPLLLQLPVWLWAVWLIAIVWRVQIHRGHLAFPSTLVKAIAAGVVVTGLLLSFSLQLNIHALIGMFFCAYVLKLIEFRTKRDGLLLVFFGFFAVGAQFLFTQSMIAAFYGFISCLVLVAAWKVLYLDRPEKISVKLRSSFVLLLHATPLMILFFIVMPRVEPLWSLPALGSSAKTGFSDEMSPGDVGRLVKSSGAAFRVEFDGAAPESSEMYWRGLVLDYFDGRSWKVYPRGQKVQQLIASDFIGESSNSYYRYTVTMEPHDQHWLFSLVEPVSVVVVGDEVRFDQRLFLTTKNPATKQVQYRAVSQLSDSHGPQNFLDEKTLAENLLIPESLNPKTQKQVSAWLDEGLQSSQIILRALSLYQESFYYTLEPPLLGRHSIDDFLFTTQQGFCEHFASSFVFMMRAAGIPSRVVAGYLGGKKNPVQNYFIVNQSDAHAWAEVWLEGVGWQRVDPTAAVSPERVEKGIADALSESDLQLVGRGAYGEFPWIKSLRQRVDAVGYVWNRWVVSYDSQSQKSVLEKLFGGAEPWRIAMIVVIASLVLGLALFLYFYLINLKRPLPIAIRLIDKFISKAESLGIKQSQGETVSSFARRVAVERPELAQPTLALAAIFDRITYRGDVNNLDKLRKLVRNFPKVTNKYS